MNVWNTYILKEHRGNYRRPDETIKNLAVNWVCVFNTFIPEMNQVYQFNIFYMTFITLYLQELSNSAFLKLD